MFSFDNVLMELHTTLQHGGVLQGCVSHLNGDPVHNINRPTYNPALQHSEPQGSVQFGAGLQCYVQVGLVV